MRRLLVLFASLVPAIAGAGELSQAGDVELTQQIGWQWGGTQDYTSGFGFPAGGSLHAEANLNYGGTLSMVARPGYALELGYNYQSTGLTNRPVGGPEYKLADLGTHYILVSGRRELPTAGRATPFVLGGVGGVGFYASGVSNWFWAFTVGGGLKADLSPKMALRLQARALVPIQWGSSSLYFGSGGSGVSVSGGTSIFQGDASAGLVFKLGRAG
jgi:opacity protein-like surface antigen